MVKRGTREVQREGLRRTKVQKLKTLASMDFLFPWNSNKFTITRWLSTFFLIHPLHPNDLLDMGVIINVNISNE
jgi:hypothetical protein